MNIKNLKDINIKLKDWNLKYGEEVAGQKESIKERRKLNSISIQLDRLKKAEGTRTAIGVFGQSQCGKSYLTSELIGGAETKLIVKGKEDSKFHDYNQNEAGRESTALVTRLTSKKESYSAPENSVMVRYLSSSDIMWSFVYGFYNELKWTTGFKLTEDQVAAIEKGIQSPDTSTRMMIDIELLADEFSECQTWINQNMSYPYPLADIAVDYFSNHDEISVDKYIQLVSTLWNSDKNITQAFRARIETLYSLGFALEGSIPESLLKRVLDASSSDNLSLAVTSNDIIPSQNGDLIHGDSNADASGTKIANIQAIIKEICLLADVKKDSVASKIDVLDFPGARALTGLDGGQDSIEINESIDNNSSTSIAQVFKRGKLTYLFDLYKKNFDVSLLIFCTESNATQEAKSLRKMLSSWIDTYKGESSEIKNPSLFVAFTKSDRLLKTGGNETVENANNRISSRFKENFQDSFGSWTKNYINKNNRFSNIYLVRNPKADNESFDKIDNSTGETWRAGFEEGRDILRSAWETNKKVAEYLGENKMFLFDNVFEPNKYGIDHLIGEIIKKFDSDPNKKQNFLKNKVDELEKTMLSYVEKYSPDTNKQVAEEKQRVLANSFINNVEKKYESVALILNAIHENCPESSYLDSLIRKSNNTSTGVAPISLGSPLKIAVPKFIDNWFSKLNKHNSLSGDLAVDKSDLELFFNNLKKYILRKEKILELLDSFKNFNLIGNPAHIKALRNYLIWHVGEKVYYLEYIEVNGTPNKSITIPDSIDFRDFILNQVWKKQLPEIYAGNFEMKIPRQGSNQLIAIREMFL